MKSQRILVAGLWLAALTAAHAETLSTPSFTVTITEHCEEGVVVCDSATYVGVSRKTGKSITLKGTAIAHNCLGTDIPCHHLGYRFKNGKILYTVTDDGELTVSNGDKVLLRERGEWLP